VAAPVTFGNPWEGEEWDTPTTHVVMIGDVGITHAEPGQDEVCVLTMWEIAYA
jgi:hypothetical protein